MDIAMDSAVVYLRKSRDPHNLASIDDQRRHGCSACEAEGWHVAAVLDDAGRSASRFATKGRPAWDELLAMIKAGQIRVVVLWESNRGDRKLTQWSAFLDLCREHGIRIHVVSHERTYDPRLHRDWKTLAEDGVSNAYFSDQLSAVVRRGNAGAALRGEPYGPVPYGYKAVYSEETGKREGWVKIPELAEHVEFIVDWIGGHKPVMALERDLYKRGVKSPTGKDRWDQATLRDVARNPVYAALRRLSDGTLIEGKWPPIVERQQWADACAALDVRKPMARPGKQKHLCSYVARCGEGECNAPFAVYRREDRLYYRCKDGHFSIRYEWLDDCVSMAMVAWLSQPNARDTFRRDDVRSAGVAGELATLTARRKSFRAKAAEGGIEADALAEIEAELNPKITAKQRELEALTIPPALHRILGADNVAEIWEDMIVQERRAVITALVDGIVVHRPPRRWRSMVLPDPSDPGELVEFQWKT